MEKLVPKTCPWTENVNLKQKEKEYIKTRNNMSTIWGMGPACAFVDPKYVLVTRDLT